jgi:hypothetical protein
MKPLPNLDDTQAMIAKGRRSALMSARNDAMDELRDSFTKMQSLEIGAIQALANKAHECCLRLIDVSVKWNELDGTK